MRDVENGNEINNQEIEARREREKGEMKDLEKGFKSWQFMISFPASFTLLMMSVASLFFIADFLITALIHCVGLKLYDNNRSRSELISNLFSVKYASS